MGGRLASVILLILSLFWRPAFSDTGSAVKSDGPDQYANIRRGVTVSGERFPYVCYVSVTKRTFSPPVSSGHYCAGVLYRRKWVITVAHCVYEVDGIVVKPTPTVYCGFNDRYRKYTAQSANAKRTHLHDSWTGDRLDGYDIAVVELEKEIDLDGPEVADRDVEFNDGQKFATVAWGRVSDTKRARYLQMADNLVYVSPEECREHYDDLSTESPWICAKSADQEQDSCRGDCGGPLLIPHMPEGVIKAGDPKRDWVVGIKTYGIIECDGKNPDVYTRIAPFWGWISGIIEKDKASTKERRGTTGREDALPQTAEDGAFFTETVKSAERDDGIKPEAARTSGSHFEDTSQHGPERIVEIA